MNRIGAGSKQLMAVLIAAMSLLVTVEVQAVDMQAIQHEFDKKDKHEAIHERTKPVGQVHVKSVDATKETKANATTQVSTKATIEKKPIVAEQIAGIGLNGKQIYQKFCVACHLTGAANAPKLGDKANWETRIKAASEREGGLLETVKNGQGAMPPKGMCQNCNDDDLQAAIDFMLQASL